MKGLACPCPALPKFLELGTCLMAEGSRTQARGQGPPVNIQFLRAQYEGLRKQQRTQAHLMVFPKGRAGRVLQRGELLWVEPGGLKVHGEEEKSCLLTQSAPSHGSLIRVAVPSLFLSQRNRGLSAKHLANGHCSWSPCLFSPNSDLA